ncbi:MAG: hypothetical protein M3501_03185 [Actinomycetota bacterium]|nr:hypothetical protein [Actinomycetota bacterium]MDQ3312441.1 hypothetical protein [Actinomycetota bacterium]MDQ3350953.1 hypothetical protein [Actinomycetota bacterium]
MSAEDARGVALALELLDLAIEMRAQQYRRLHPEGSQAEVDKFVQDWLLERPGAPYGDAVGRPVSLRT